MRGSTGYEFSYSHGCVSNCKFVCIGSCACVCVSEVVLLGEFGFGLGISAAIKASSVVVISCEYWLVVVLVCSENLFAVM